MSRGGGMIVCRVKLPGTAERSAGEPRGSGCTCFACSEAPSRLDVRYQVDT